MLVPWVVGGVRSDVWINQRDGQTESSLHEYFVHELMIPLEPCQRQRSRGDHFLF